MKFTLSIALSDPLHYCPLAVSAEEVGWDAVALPDSVFFPEKVSADYPYTTDGERFWEADTPWIEPFVAIPAMAAVTRRIHFYTHVLKLAIRNPLLVAKTVGSAAVMSQDRVGLGAGLGWIPEEFAWCGTEYKTRGERMNEALEILRLCLGGGMVEYHGKHYHFDRLQMSPAPRKRVPIYIGGHSQPGLKRAAKYGDGWSSAMTTEEQTRTYVADLMRFRKELGRDHLPFEIQVASLDAFDVDAYKRLAEIGVTDIITQPWLLYGAGPQSTLEQKKDSLKRFADAIFAPMGR
jgi:probable F420-dependent oxidoreductase